MSLDKQKYVYCPILLRQRVYALNSEAVPYSRIQSFVYSKKQDNPIA